MRKEFFTYLLEKMDQDPKIYTVFIGLGYPRYDEFKQRHPARTINTEASEQTALDIATGLALEGKKPFTYTITPFYWRGAETIRTYISHERIPVRMCGAGRGDDYTVDDGFSHDGHDVALLMGVLDIRQFYPDSVEEMKKCVDHMVKNDEPRFLNLRR